MTGCKNSGLYVDDTKNIEVNTMKNKKKQEASILVAGILAAGFMMSQSIIIKESTIGMLRNGKLRKDKITSGLFSLAKI